MASGGSAGVVILGQDGSCREKGGREGERGGTATRRIAVWRKEEDCRLTFPDAEKSPLFFFFLEPSRPRAQSVVSLKDFSVFDERVLTSCVFRRELTQLSRQINFSKLIYLRRVIRWLSRLLALTRPCVSETFVCFAWGIVPFTMPSLLRFRTGLWIAVTTAKANRYHNATSSFMTSVD